MQREDLSTNVLPVYVHIHPVLHSGAALCSMFNYNAAYYCVEFVVMRARSSHRRSVHEACLQARRYFTDSLSLLVFPPS